METPVYIRFEFKDLSTEKAEHFCFSDKITLNKKYISFLVRRIPEDLLCFGITGGPKDPVRLYRGEEHIGILMPIIPPPAFGPEMEKKAEAGDAESQYKMGIFCSLKTILSSGRNSREAVRWNAAAAAQDHPRACLSLGQFFTEGRFVKRDLAKSLVLLEHALKQRLTDKSHSGRGQPRIFSIYNLTNILPTLGSLLHRRAHFFSTLGTISSKGWKNYWLAVSYANLSCGLRAKKEPMKSNRVMTRQARRLVR